MLYPLWINFMQFMKSVDTKFQLLTASMKWPELCNTLVRTNSRQNCCRMMKVYLQVTQMSLGWSQDAGNGLAPLLALPGGLSHAPIPCGSVLCSSQVDPCVTAHSGLGNDLWSCMKPNTLCTDFLVTEYGSSTPITPNATTGHDSNHFHPLCIFP
jgi:hypothetical protein